MREIDIHPRESEILFSWFTPSTEPTVELSDSQHNGPYNRLSQKGRRRRAKQKLSNSGRRVR